MEPASGHPSAAAIARFLNRRVIGQAEAVRAMSVALAQRLAGVRAGNILLIGASGSGKTTLLRAAQEVLEEAAGPREVVAVVRVHARVLAEEAPRAGEDHPLLRRLWDAAASRLGQGADPRTIASAVRRGVVFLDEVDKIRGRVGDEVHVDGIRAQEALLTLVESEDWRMPAAGAGVPNLTIDTRELLFVAAGAFEGLYEAVHDRVTVGADRGSLQPRTTVAGEEVREETVFHLQDWLLPEDLYDYGLGPQFLARFETHILLADLDAAALEEILATATEGRWVTARAYLAALGIRLEITSDGRRRLAQEAARHPRIGARALSEVSGRVLRDVEFDPFPYAREGLLVLDAARVEDLLRSEPPVGTAAGPEAGAAESSPPAGTG